MEMARIISKRSRCSRDKVGAVVVSLHNRIVDTGYNGPPAHHFPSRDSDTACVNWCSRSLMAQQSVSHGLSLDYSDCPSLHAEANALMFGDRVARQHGTMYVSSGVCTMCAKLIANSGLMRVVIDMTTTFAHRNVEVGVAFMQQCGLKVDLVTE